MNFTYYPGCAVKTSAQGYERSAVAVLHALGVALHELEEWNCCGVVHTLSRDDLLRQIAPIQVLARVQQAQSDRVVTLCDMCYNTLSRANIVVRENGEQRKTVNAFMEPESRYDGVVTVHHLLQVLRDTIGFDAVKKRVKQPLRGLRVFPYYGCMLLRPGEVSIDDPEEPSVLEHLMRALGAEVVDDPVKIECCGSHHTVTRPTLIFERVEKIVGRAKSKGAHAIVLSCPLCRFNLDARQKEDRAILEPLPVFYYTQLMCLAFGLEEATMGLDTHRVDPRPMLQDWHSSG